MPRCVAVIALLIGLVSAATAEPVAVTDSQGNRFTLEREATRIVSLAPHLTELVFSLGAGEHLVGAVEYSDIPEAAKEIERIGDAFRLDFERIVQLQPDLVLAWKHGNRNTDIERLRTLGLQVFENHALAIDDIAVSVENLGTLTGRIDRAKSLAGDFRRKLSTLEPEGARYQERPVAVFFQIWDSPLMTVGGTHLINEAITHCGGRNVFESLTAPAPQVSPEAVAATDPELILGGDRPEWRQRWLALPALRAVARDQVVDLGTDTLSRASLAFLTGVETLCHHIASARRHRP